MKIFLFLFSLSFLPFFSLSFLFLFSFFSLFLSYLVRRREFFSIQKSKSSFLIFKGQINNKISWVIKLRTTIHFFDSIFKKRGKKRRKEERKRKEREKKEKERRRRKRREREEKEKRKRKEREKRTFVQLQSQNKKWPQKQVQSRQFSLRINNTNNQT